MSKNRVAWCNRGWQPVEFGFCPNGKAWRRQMKRMGVSDADYPTSDGAATTFTKDGKTIVLITVRDGAEHERTLIELIGILVHEAAHVWQEVRLATGERSPSIEFEAYSMQAITQELLDGFAETRGLPRHRET